MYIYSAFMIVLLMVALPMMSVMCLVPAWVFLEFDRRWREADPPNVMAFPAIYADLQVRGNHRSTARLQGLKHMDHHHLASSYGAAPVGFESWGMLTVPSTLPACPRL